MWLIDTKTLKLCYFNNEDEVDYAILSHRWEEEEVSLQEFKDGSGIGKKGYAKIERSCTIALQSDIRYMWIDTCCIDKTSSAELSEAINSMYRWYEQAKICYAYLSDVETIDDLAGSKWFTRGWTLQELIAPKTVKFYDNNWYSFGSKNGLQGRIASITGIPLRVLRGSNVSDYSVAQRMSWAAHRITTRPEDQAYCLMGLFEVNMPMLYGEGTKAFARLQEEIIKILDDQSIFAWTGHTSGYFPVLAPSPANFKHSAGIRSTSATTDPMPFSLTNVGLRIELPIVPFAMDTYLAVLQCQDVSIDNYMMPHARSDTGNSRIGILIRRTSQPKQYVRCVSIELRWHQIDTMWYANSLKTVPVLLLQRMRKLDGLNDMYGFHFRTITDVIFRRQNSSNSNAASSECSVVCRLPRDQITTLRRLYPSEVIHDSYSVQVLRNIANLDLITRFGKQGTVATFKLKDERAVTSPSTVVLMKFGFDFDFNPVCILYGMSSEKWYSHCRSGKTYWADNGNLDEELARYMKIAPEQCWERHGVCALVGSRSSGLDVTLTDHNIHLTIVEGIQQGAKKWIVDVSACDLPFVDGNCASEFVHLAQAVQDRE